MPDEVVGSPEALERFKREAQSASALNHPNICTIYEIGQDDGCPFIALEMMKGQTLKYAIGARALDTDAIIDLAIGIADALDAAHAEHIIHRDIKPANIFVTERGHAKLLDFGLAKQTAQITPANTEMPTESKREDLTRSGATIGTVAYMSPEQGRGKELDARTDLFSFGVVLYEMVTGVLPFPGKNAGEILEAIFTKQPVTPVRLNQSVPPKLEDIINKALEKDRNLRYSSAAEIRTDLQRLKRDTSSSRPGIAETAGPVRSYAKPGNKTWLLVALLIGVFLFAGVFFLSRTMKAPEQAMPPETKVPVQSEKEAPSIAVLPFEDLSPLKDQEYFADGLAEELLNDLSKIQQLRVVARTSSFSFKGKNEDLRLIAQKLNVKSVLEGSVRKEGKRVRITAQLINAVDGFHLWSETYDRDLNDIFAVQDDIAASVAGTLKLRLLGDHTPEPGEKEVSVEAYNAYLQGRYFSSRRRKEDLEKAVRYFEQALQIDPNYAQAWVGLSSAHSSQAGNGYISAEEGYKKARREVDQALKLDPKLAVAHARLGGIQRFYDWDWKAADASLQHALELEPGNASVLGSAAGLAFTLGRFDEAIALMRRAIELDPLSFGGHYYLGVYYLYVDRMNDAELEFRKTLELNPQYPVAHLNLGLIYLKQSKVEAAFTEIRMEPHPSWRLYGLSLAYYSAGKKNEADASLMKYIEENMNNGAFQIAEIYAYRNERDKAFEWLERAYRQHDSGLAFIKGNPVLSSLNGDPRWPAFLKKMRLPVD